jgi:hypothetical protein
MPFACFRRTLLDLLRGFPKIGFTHDIVAVENRPGLVTADAHRDTLRNAPADHVPDRGTPQIMEQQS